VSYICVCLCVCARARTTIQRANTSGIGVRRSRRVWYFQDCTPMADSEPHTCGLVCNTLAAAGGAGGSSWAYTFNQWDNHSAVIDPITKAVTALPGNIKLLSHEWELAMMNDIRQRDGGQYDECLPTYHT
jgi:hypothetical protein